MTIWIASIPLEHCRKGTASWTLPEAGWKMMRRKRPLILNLDPDGFLKEELQERAKLEMNLYQLQCPQHPEAMAYFDVVGDRTSGPFSEEGFDRQNRLLCQLALGVSQTLEVRTNLAYWWNLPEGQVPDEDGKQLVNPYLHLKGVNYLRANVLTFETRARTAGMSLKDAADHRNQLASKILKLPLLTNRVRERAIQNIQLGDDINKVLERTKLQLQALENARRSIGRGLTNNELY
jgi:hypothetical protein